MKKIITLKNGIEGLFIENQRFNTTSISFNFYLPLKKRGRWETKPVGLWTEGSPDGDSREAIAYWQDAKSQTTRKPKSLTEQMARQISSVYGKWSRGMAQRNHQTRRRRPN